MAFAKWSLWLKIKTAKKMRKTIQPQNNCLVQKTARKNSNIREMRPFKKISHLEKAITCAKAIAFAKWSVLVKH